MFILMFIQVDFTLKTGTMPQLNKFVSKSMENEKNVYYKPMMNYTWLPTFKNVCKLNSNLKIPLAVIVVVRAVVTCISNNKATLDFMPKQMKLLK